MISIYESTNEDHLTQHGASYKGLKIFLDKVTPKPNLKSIYIFINWKRLGGKGEELGKKQTKINK